MKRFLKWVGCVLLAALMTAPAHALTQGFALSVRRADGVGESVDMWQREGGQRYLFLPAYMRGQTLELTYEGAKTVRMGSMELSSGCETDVLEDGAKLIAQIGDSSWSIQVMASRNLPAVHLSLASGSLDYIHEKKGNREPGSVTIVTSGGKTDYSGELERVKGHGNATFAYEKKSYQIKLPKKASLLGMGEGKNYVLLANQHENSLIRNRMTFDLAAEAGLAYTPESCSVDLYVEGEYRGSYLLCDKVKISAGCVDIADSDDALEEANATFLENGGEPETYGEQDYAAGTHKGAVWPEELEDITGGYLFELEYAQRYKDETSGVVTSRGQSVVVKAPEAMSVAQGEYVSALLGHFERAIFSPDGTDAGQHYSEIADFDSLVRKYMIEEISKNYDGNKSSQYFYKDSDSVDPLIYAGPVWDYDSAWGNYARAEKLKAAAPEELAIARNGFSYSWYPALYAHREFRAEVRCLWEQEMRPMLEVIVGSRAALPGSRLSSLASYAEELYASAQMNFERWRVLGHASRAVDTGDSYEENIEYLRSWIQKRMEYLDQNW